MGLLLDVDYASSRPTTGRGKCGGVAARGCSAPPPIVLGAVALLRLTPTPTWMSPWSPWCQPHCGGLMHTSRCSGGCTALLYLVHCGVVLYRYQGGSSDSVGEPLTTLAGKVCPPDNTSPYPSIPWLGPTRGQRGSLAVGPLITIRGRDTSSLCSSRVGTSLPHRGASGLGP